MKARASTVGSRAGVAALLVMAGCAAGARNVATISVGRATRTDIMEEAPSILYRQGYEMQDRRDTGSMIRYTSSWVTREPFADEASRGAVECRTRLTFEARQAGGNTYTVSLRAENMMQRGFDGTWVELAPTPTFREHLRSVSEALALELDMGVRTR